MISGSPGVPQIVNPDATQMAGDFELLMTDDDFDMLQDLEFYSWVDIDAAFESESGADVG
jgi:hypothetical protein